MDIRQVLFPTDFSVSAEAAGRVAVEMARQCGATLHVVHVVPLLVESPGYRERVGRVLVVDCPEALQISRVRQRSGLPEAEVRRIIASQIQRERRLAAADDVIDNSGSIAAMQHRVGELHEKYLALAKA